MRDGAGRSAPREAGGSPWLALLLVPVALLPDLAAGLPRQTYFFRDFTATFLPLRLFAARELGEGRLPLWNPYVFEGTFQLPALYPGDLLHVLWPSPAFVSWVLTLHVPLAALAAFWLARELGAARPGAFLAGAAYALGGFALSCLNLYVFLQALALAPLLAGLLRRAARDGGRLVVAAGALLALSLYTLALEFVAQALLLGLGLGFVAAPRLEGLRRLAGAVGLGIGLAGLPVALVVGLLPETARGAGFSPEVALSNAVHPAVLLQVLMPNLFGVPSAPAEAWWGGHFFSKGLPYFLSLYTGPLVLSLAAVGVLALPRGARAILVALGVLGLWYALGEPGGLAPLVARLPVAAMFRFPSKALLLPYLALALAAGFGADRLRARSRSFLGLAVGSGAAAVVGLSVAALVKAAPGGLVAWTGVAAGFWPQLADVARRDALVLLALAAVTAGLAVAVRRGWLRPGPASLLVVALAAADLARAGAGLNRQVHPSFFDPLPEMAALPLRDPAGGRLFSYGVDESPSFRTFLGRGGPERTLAGLFVYRQMLGPYTNVLAGVETPEASDLTAFAPRARELSPSLYDPAEIGRLLPWLRNAAVSRVLSLDPLVHPQLFPLGTVAPGPPGLAIRLYGLEPWPRVYVACRVIDEADTDQAALRPFASDFDPGRDVVLAGAEPARCRRAWARARGTTPGEERYEVEADGEGYLVVRASYSRGWRARVDGEDAPVLRASGKHRAVPVPPGRHEVVLRYDPPGLLVGLALTALALLAAGATLIVSGPRRAFHRL